MNLRLVALGGVVACALALPLAMASAGQVGDEGRSGGRVPRDGGVGGRDDDRDGGRHSRTDPKAPPAVPSPSPLGLGLGLATAVRCGPELTSPEGVEAQTCVLTQGADTWARTYYRNATGRALDAVLSLMGPRERTVQMRCAVAVEDEPGACETPREHTRGTLDAYTAVAEFAETRGVGGANGSTGAPGGEVPPLLLRSGSDFAPADGG